MTPSVTTVPSGLVTNFGVVPVSATGRVSSGGAVLPNVPAEARNASTRLGAASAATRGSNSASSATVSAASHSVSSPASSVLPSTAASAGGKFGAGGTGV